MHVVPIQGISPCRFEHKYTPRAWALVAIEEKLQGMSPRRCWVKTPVHKSSSLNEYAWDSISYVLDIMNILMNPTISNNILDRHMQLNLNYKQQHGSNKQS